MGLKGLFEKVLGLARGVDTPEDPALDAPTERAGEPLVGEQDEPIRTRTMAGLLAEQGHLTRAIGIYRELGDAESRASAAALEERLARREQQDRARPRLERAAGEANPDGVQLFQEAGLCAIAWRVDDGRGGYARAVLGDDAALCLRRVSICADPGIGALTTHLDRAPIEPAGSALVELVPGARTVFSVGLKSGDRFVSVAHAAG